MRLWARPQHLVERQTQIDIVLHLGAHQHDGCKVAEAHGHTALTMPTARQENAVEITHRQVRRGPSLLRQKHRQNAPADLGAVSCSLLSEPAPRFRAARAPPPPRPCRLWI